MEQVAASTAICSDPTKKCDGCVYDHLCGTDSEQAPDLLREAGGLIWELLGELDGIKLMGELDRRESGQLPGKTEQSEDRATGGGEGPCGIFRNICFPVGEFFPPNTVKLPENYEDAKFCCASGR